MKKGVCILVFLVFNSFYDIISFSLSKNKPNIFQLKALIGSGFQYIYKKNDVTQFCDDPPTHINVSSFNDQRLYHNLGLELDYVLNRRFSIAFQPVFYCLSPTNKIIFGQDPRFKIDLNLSLQYAF